VIAWVMVNKVNGTNKDLIPTFRFKSGTCNSGTGLNAQKCGSGSGSGMISDPCRCIKSSQVKSNY
jgi:hypothetical protein